MTEKPAKLVRVYWGPRDEKAALTYKTLFRDRPVIPFDIEISFQQESETSNRFYVQLVPAANPKVPTVYASRKNGELDARFPVVLFDEIIAADRMEELSEVLIRMCSLGFGPPGRALFALIIKEYAEYEPPIPPIRAKLESDNIYSSVSVHWYNPRQTQQSNPSDAVLSLSGLIVGWNAWLDDAVTSSIVDMNIQSQLLKGAIRCWKTEDIRSLLPTFFTKEIETKARLLAEETEAFVDALKPRAKKPLYEVGPDFKWENVRFHFLKDEHRVQIWVGSDQKIFAAKTLGLKRGGAAANWNKRAGILLKFSEYGDIKAKKIYPDEARQVMKGSPEEQALRANARAAIRRLRLYLQSIFGVKDDPLYPPEKDDGWRPKFSVTVEKHSRDSSR